MVVCCDLWWFVVIYFVRFCQWCMIGNWKKIKIMRSMNTASFEHRRWQMIKALSIRLESRTNRYSTGKHLCNGIIFSQKVACYGQYFLAACQELDANPPGWWISHHTANTLCKNVRSIAPIVKRSISGSQQLRHQLSWQYGPTWIRQYNKNNPKLVSVFLSISSSIQSTHKLVGSF
jgi:hypothetical protein